jgi:hypothetical protein
VDNASSNNTFIDCFAASVESGSCIRDDDGKLIFHVRCFAHILNLIAGDGIAVMKQTIEGLRTAIKKSKSSQLQMTNFALICQSQRIPGKIAKPSLDVSTRWNSTYDMMESAIPYLGVFDEWARSGEENAPPPIDPFDILDIKDLHQWLKPLKDMTLNVSHHETIAMCHGLVWMQKLQKQLRGMEAMTSKLATAKENMILKFEKYFSDTKDILVHIIASIFHPQYKTSIIDAVFSTQRAILLEKIVKIFERNYVSNDDVAQTVSNDVIRTLSFDAIDEDLAFLGVNSNRPQLMSMRQEFDQYINEPPMKCTDILVYWRSKEQVYPHLVKMALDFLCIQLSSVASEFAFSGSGRVMDDYRSRLAEATLEMLMQLQSWLKNSKKHNF